MQPVAKDYDRDADAVAHRRLYLLAGHEEAPVAADRNDLARRVGELRADRARHAVAHRAVRRRDLGARKTVAPVAVQEYREVAGVVRQHGVLREYLAHRADDLGRVDPLLRPSRRDLAELQVGPVRGRPVALYGLGNLPAQGFEGSAGIGDYAAHDRDRGAHLVGVRVDLYDGLVPAREPVGLGRHLAEAAPDHDDKVRLLQRAQDLGPR